MVTHKETEILMGNKESISIENSAKKMTKDEK